MSTCATPLTSASAFANVLTSKRHHHEETRNVPLHLMQSDLHAHLYRSLSNYADDGLVGHFKDDLGYLADLAHRIAYERYQQYRAWTWRCINNRARFLELQAYEHFAQGLLILSTHLDPAERSHEFAHEYRYCSNCVIAELVDFALPMVRPSCANRCDLLERWSENAQLWDARDAPAKPDPRAAPQYQLILRNSKRGLSRTDPDTRP